MTSQTPALAVDIASDKSLTNNLLNSAGLPVPRSQTVRSEDEAVAAAKTLGFPVVIKPLDGNHGRGVNLNLLTDDDVRRAVPLARAQSRNGDLVVETYVYGNDYRVLVVDGKMAAVAQRVPAGVNADGEHTLRQLVDIENADPRRGIGHEKVLTRIQLNDMALELAAKQGFGPDDVPPNGTRVQLALTGNMSTGGTAIDRTHEAHPDNVEIAETAARVVGLDVAGIDFITPDIATPVREKGGAIVEVNAAPGFRMHTNPTEGEPQYVAKPVLDMLFPQGSNARIPIVAVTGTNGKTTTVRMIGHILKLMGKRVGMTTTDGIVVDGRLIRKGDMSGPRSARMVLQNPSVDTCVFEVARGGILREGLGYDRNDIAVVTNVTGDHLGLHGIDTVGQLAAVKSVLVDAVPRSGTAVLNADDPLVAKMARQSRGHVVYFSMQTKAGEDGYDRVDGHCGRGGAALVLQQTDEGELMVLRHATRTLPLLYTHLIPATFGGRARMNVANALAAAAAAWAAGAHLHDIRQGLRTFTTSFFQAPGRLNEVELNGFKLILDYCHNVDGMRRLAEFVEAYAGDGDGRTIGVIGIPGDRRDDDQREYGRLAAQAFDTILVREDANLRGRPAGESAANVLNGVTKGQREGARTAKAEAVLDELGAARMALAMAKPGDLVVMCVDDAAGVYREAIGARKGARRRGHRRPRRAGGRRGLVGDPFRERCVNRAEDVAVDVVGTDAIDNALGLEHSSDAGFDPGQAQAYASATRQLLDLGQFGGALGVDQVDSLEVEHERLNRRVVLGQAANSFIERFRGGEEEAAVDAQHDDAGKGLVLWVGLEVAEHLRAFLPAQERHARSCRHRYQPDQRQADADDYAEQDTDAQHADYGDYGYGRSRRASRAPTGATHARRSCRRRRRR